MLVMWFLSKHKFCIGDTSVVDATALAAGRFRIHARTSAIRSLLREGFECAAGRRITWLLVPLALLPGRTNDESAFGAGWLAVSLRHALRADSNGSAIASNLHPRP